MRIALLFSYVQYTNYKFHLLIIFILVSLQSYWGVVLWRFQFNMWRLIPKTYMVASWAS